MIISRSTVRSKTMGIRTDQLWLVCIMICFALIVSLMPVFPNDFWWHLKIGEIIYTTRSVPETNMFAWTLTPDHPFTYGAWLAEYLFYLLYLAGGISLILIVRTILMVAAFALIGAEAIRKSGSWRIAGLVMMLAAGMASNNTVIRPQIWAWIPFVGFVIILNRFVDRQIRPIWLILLPFLMMFWVNVHGSFIVGLVLIAIYFTGELLRWLLKQEGTLQLKDLILLVGTGIFSGLATVVNPKFFGIFNYVVKMMTDKPSQRLVAEWQSPAPDHYAGILFFAAVLITLVVFAYSRYKPTITEILLMLAFLWLAFSGIRYVVWYGLISMPIVGKAISNIVKDKPWMALPPKNFLNVIFVALLLVPVILVQPQFIEKLPLPASYWKFVLRDNGVAPLLTIHTPIGAANYLKEHPGGKLFNEMGYGSYLIWAVPEQQVFSDPRVELYPYDLWLDYLKIVGGVRVEELLDKYNVDRVLLAKEENGELIHILESDLAWSLQYEDQYSQIWGR